jgi:DNA invertase Pin-like site-specific DNA recombinase
VRKPPLATRFNPIRERTVAGLKAARARGRKGGRPAKLSAKEIKTIRALLKTADIPVAEIAAPLWSRPVYPVPRRPQACGLTIHR